MMAGKDTISSSGFSLSQQHKDDALLIEGYGPRYFKMRGSRADGSMVILPTGFYPLGVDIMGDITAGHIEKILTAAQKPELVLIGTGAKMLMIPASLRQLFTDHAIGIEFMDTGAACRTYNILTLEDRRVSAVLMAIDSD